MAEPTKRQKDILWRIAEGYTDPMIAAALGIERSTVHGHVGQLFDRIGVHTRAAAVAMAFRQGWIE
jgi:DNA-binding NarL/FixJ family response regulator